MKGGSVASDFVLNELLPSKCKNVLKPYKFAVGNSDLKNVKLYQIGSGKKKTKKVSKKKKRMKKSSKKKYRGGSPMSKVVNKIALLRSISSKKSPGVFPKQKNCGIKVIDIPKLVGGKKKRKYNKKGGSDWVSTVRSYSYTPQSKKRLGKFTNSNQYIQNKNKLSKGPMFFPLSLKKKINSVLKKKKIGPFRFTSKTRKMISDISNYPMFELFK